MKPPPKPPPPPSSLFTALADAVFSLQPSPTHADPRRRRLSSEARRRSTSAHAVEALNSLKLAAAGPTVFNVTVPPPISPLSSPISPLFHFRILHMYGASFVCSFCELAKRICMGQNVFGIFLCAG
ncbi:hypothetical protein CMV_021159 [Castanea mollissima]|uniref:Uncharacterized protein n=1 Tax=Castanea mollissima TaxID=60419 RepID=A0A8J4QKE0_9ROSI|nr:hypothetical protein CMV_021159 [Castanea mollissima]